MIDERRIGSCAEFAHDIMSVREPESCWQISGERRMTITIAAIAAESSEATNRDIMSTKVLILKVPYGTLYVLKSCTNNIIN